LGSLREPNAPVISPDSNAAMREALEFGFALTTAATAAISA